MMFQVLIFSFYLLTQTKSSVVAHNMCLTSTLFTYESYYLQISCTFNEFAQKVHKLHTSQ